MADELYDGEFWLPSHFLTDDDILVDFSNSETSDDDDLLLPKLPLLSTSPQSTLFGCDCNHQGSVSSVGSPTAPNKHTDDTTLDLLNKAAGEVAKMKLRSDNTTGTGFFDCSKSANKLFSLPQPPPPPPSSYFHPLFHRFPPHTMWGPVQIAPPQQNQQGRGTKNNSSSSTTNSSNNNNNNNNNNNRPLGLPPAAWPPLRGKAQAEPAPQPQAQPMMGMFAGPRRESAGTGVFLPRRVASPAEPKRKSGGNTLKTKNKEGSQRRNTHPTKANHKEIQLPSEWVY